IPRYRPDGTAAGPGRGLYADRVLRAFPLLAVEDEGRLNDAALREAFCERIFAAAPLRELLRGPPPPRDLPASNARHKLQRLAPARARYRAAGRVLAGEGTEVAYRALFLGAMASRATPGRNANALQHAYSRIGRRLGRARRLDLLARIE